MRGLFVELLCRGSIVDFRVCFSRLVVERESCSGERLAQSNILQFNTASYVRSQE